jgi:Domain of unknown function (DUF4145)
MKRSLWTHPLTERSSPAWPCPACSNGTLALVPNSLVAKETVESRQLYEVLCEPESTAYTFSAWLRCNYGDCGEEVVVVGNGTVARFDRMNEAGEEEEKYIRSFHPLFCWPMPDMFELPEKCPPEVQTELRAGFRLFWSDQAASAGRVRVSLERLMDHYRIPELKLHDRIKEFSKAETTAGEKLMALKWLGNTGSHQGSVSRDDLLDGFEVLEYSIAELFDQRTARVAELARQLMRKHAPRRK